MRIDRIRPILPGKPLAGRDREQKGREGDRKDTLPLSTRQNLFNRKAAGRLIRVSEMEWIGYKPVHHRMAGRKVWEWKFKSVNE